MSFKLPFQKIRSSSAAEKLRYLSIGITGIYFDEATKATAFYTFSQEASVELAAGCLPLLCAAFADVIL